MLYGLAGVAGFVACAFLANRRPQWFAKVVAVGNAVDAKVNATAAQVAQKVQNK